MTLRIEDYMTGEWSSARSRKTSAEAIEEMIAPYLLPGIDELFATAAPLGSWAFLPDTRQTYERFGALIRGTTGRSLSLLDKPPLRVVPRFPPTARTWLRPTMRRSKVMAKATAYAAQLVQYTDRVMVEAEAMTVQWFSNLLLYHLGYLYRLTENSSVFRSARMMVVSTSGDERQRWSDRAKEARTHKMAFVLGVDFWPRWTLLYCKALFSVLLGNLRDIHRETLTDQKRAFAHDYRFRYESAAAARSLTNPVLAHPTGAHAAGRGLTAPFWAAVNETRRTLGLPEVSAAPAPGARPTEVVAYEPLGLQLIRRVIDYCPAEAWSRPLEEEALTIYESPGYRVYHRLNVSASVAAAKRKKKHKFKGKKGKRAKFIGLSSFSASPRSSSSPQ